MDKPEKKAPVKKTPAKKKAPVKKKVPVKKKAVKKPVIKVAKAKPKPKKKTVKKMTVKQTKSPAKPTNLKVSHEVFVNAFISNGYNASRAYMTAYGCADSTARNNAYRLLENEGIKLAIRKALEESFEENDISPQRVLEEIAKMAYSNMDDFITINDDGSPYVNLTNVKGKRRKLAAIQELTSETYMEKTGDDKNPVVPVKKTKLKLADKRGSLELLGRHLKMFSDLAPSPDKAIKSILEKSRDGELTPLEAAYEINILGLPLPEVLKLQIAKTDITPMVDDAKGMTVEEIERRAREAFASQDRERIDFLPKRQQEVLELKEQMKSEDSFAPVSDRDDIP